ncbi:MAG: 50S ribosomal protein L18 [Candidatus Nanoarchaeia archaeon]
MKTVKRRRLEHKTNYASRLKLLKSEKPRLVFRKSNKYLIAQYTQSKEAQDKVELSINSKKLLKNGWPSELKNSLKSIPAAYLTGFLIGKKIEKRKLETPIIDFGMVRVIHKSKTFAFIKGLKDSGLGIKSKEEVFPNEDRIQGKHMKKDFSENFKKIKSEIEKNG